MKYPLMGRRSRNVVNVPKLSGGVNLRDSLTGIRDNQLTNCVNMWYKNGILRTRPPFITNHALITRLEKTPDNLKPTTHFHSDIKLKYKDGTYIVVTDKLFYNGDDVKEYNINFVFYSKNSVLKMPGIKNIAEQDVTYFLVENNNILYCYISDYSIWKLDYAKKSEQNLEWEKIELSKSYIPLVMTHCKAKETNGIMEYTGTQLESFNALNNSFRMIFSSVNREAFINGVTEIRAEYPLLTINALDNLYDSTFKATLTSQNGVSVTHTVYCNGDNEKNIWFEDVETITGDLLYMYVKVSKNNATVGFSTIKNQAETKKLEECDFVEDNLEITAIIPKTENLKLNKIFNMQKSIWFGGSSSGIYSGSRLFLGANTNNNYKALVIWSALNNPLYFPENCYAYVGNSSSGVTTFGHQEDKLIIFKENEVYCTHYVYNNITADQIINQSIVDYEANAVCFPMLLLNGLVGCDCPNTVQMCRNRLVWANSKGRVYTLCKINQYDEHSIYEISAMIDSKLKNYTDMLRSATAADFDGHYILFLGDCAFVADYNSYGYQYIYSYSKTDDANALLPWYYWDFSFLKTDNEIDIYQSPDVCVFDGLFLLRAYFNSSEPAKNGFVVFEMDGKNFSSADEIYYNDFKGDSFAFKEYPINCSMSTKLFELGDGIYNLNVDNITLKLGSNDGAEIVIELNSEKGKEIAVVTERRKYDQINDKDFIRPIKVYPCMRAIRKFAISMSCEGRLAIDGLSICYRLLGGSK